MTDGLASRLRCYLVTDTRAGSVERILEISEQALAGGMTTIQLRAPGWNDRSLLDVALRLRELTTAHDALFIVNDRLDVALASHADGVHLGVDDLPVDAARRVMGAEAIVGYSPDGLPDARLAVAAGASYLGVGPVYATSTKVDAGAAIGVLGIATIAKAVDIPVIGIGGINPENAAAVRSAGADGVAVVSSVFLADDPADAARRLVEALQ